MRICILVSVFLTTHISLNAQYLHHDIHARINHSEQEIKVADTIRIPAEIAGNSSTLEFSLSSNLTLEKSGAGFPVKKIGGKADEGSQRYQITLSPNRNGELIIPLCYSGVYDHDIETGAAEYARGFSSTDGIIGPEGIYLAGSSRWVPVFEDLKLFTFTLTADLGQDWAMVSQGNRTLNEVIDQRRKVRYVNADPMDEVYFIAGKWHEYSSTHGNVLIQAFLRSPDEALAGR